MKLVMSSGSSQRIDCQECFRWERARRKSGEDPLPVDLRREGRRLKKQEHYINSIPAGLVSPMKNHESLPINVIFFAKKRRVA